MITEHGPVARDCQGPEGKIAPPRDGYVYSSAMYPALLFLWLAASPAARVDWTTEFERSNGRATFTYDETMAYCRRLDAASKWIRFESFGRSAQGRDLPLLIVDKDGDFTAEKSHRRGKAIVLVQAGIHSGEIDGKDAGLMLVREMAITRERASLLDEVTFVFIPIYNVDGHEIVAPYNRVNQDGPENAGFRATANALNLNRDYMKADAPETRAWLRLWNAWDPDFLVDCHVTDGADYPYVVTYLVEWYANQDPGVATWLGNAYVPDLWRRMETSGFPLMHYTEFRKAHDPQSGIKMYASTPRFSTGYAALANRPALLVETHMMKDYPTRVRATHAIVLHTMELVGRDAALLRRTHTEADQRAASVSGRAQIPLEFETDYSESTMIDFDGYAYDAVKSEISGGTWYRYTQTPKRYRIPLFDRQKVTFETTAPRQYVIPAEWTDVVERLQAHGVAVTRLEVPRTMRVQAMRLEKPIWATKPFEGRHTVTYEIVTRDDTRRFPAGTVVVDMAQRRARIAMNLLEPGAPDALVQWGFFDTIFESKEYVESYVMERIARDMLHDRPALHMEFAEAMRDTALANHPTRVLDWFYQRSPYAETRVGEYPVVRVLGPATSE